MKKIILFAFSLFIFLQLTSAQVISKHDCLLGGSFSFSIFNVNNSGPGYYHAGNVGLFPSYGWAIKNDLVFGIRGSVNYSHFERLNTPTEKTIRSIFDFGPGFFMKKYKLIKNR